MKIEDMTLRDYFAAKAMPAVYSEYCSSAEKVGFDEGWRNGVAMDAYAMADAMLAARGQEKTNQCGETCERDKLCAVCAAPLEQETPGADGWIEWLGSYGDIIAYRVVKGGAA